MWLHILLFLRNGLVLQWKFSTQFKHSKPFLLQGLFNQSQTHSCTAFIYSTLTVIPTNLKDFTAARLLANTAGSHIVQCVLSVSPRIRSQTCLTIR